jgi:polar amino acid transport system substrate-binding protein
MTDRGPGLPSTVRRAVQLTLLATLAALATPALAEAGTTRVRAVVAPVPPFVIETEGQLSGFSIDLWNEVAVRLRLETSYRVVPDVTALAAALRTGQADVVVSAVAYTLERDREFDFTYPILNTGLQVMVPDTGQGAGDRPLRAFLGVLFSGSMLYWLTAALVLVLAPAHLIWALERRNPDGIGQGERYFPGIFHALAWTAEAMVGQAQQVPGHRLARLLAILWLFTGVVFVAFFTAQLTSDLTVQQMRGAINGPQDLPGKKVGTIEGSPAAAYLRDAGARVRLFTRPDEMYAALLGGQVDALVWGAPALQYHAAHDGQGQVRTVGPVFKKGDVGFLVQIDSPLRKRISQALLEMREDGAYQRIHQKWFGDE